MPVNRSFFYILQDFADWTGIPGLIQMINALNIYILFAWLLSFAVMWGVFFYEMVIIFQKFFSYPAAVSLSIESKFPRRFPSVTICNQNPMNYSLVQTNSAYSQINQLMEDYLESVQDGYADIKNDQFGLNSQPTPYMKREYAKEALLLLMNQLSDTNIEKAGYTFEDTFFNYYYNNRPVNSSYFTTYLDPSYGLCYQFNNDNLTDLGLLRSDKGGVGSGLRATILVHQYSPSGSQQYLPLTTSSGIRVGLNYFNGSPTMESIGIDVKPGSETWLKMKVTEIQRAKKPYGRCVDTMTGNLNYYSDFNYTMAYCLRSCVQNQYINNCTCAYPLYLKPFENNYCTISDLDCVFGMRQSQAQTATNAFNPLVNCSCFPSCLDTVYEPLLSIGQFPSASFIPRGQPGEDESPYTCSTSNQLFNGSIKTCLKWWKDNALVLNVYYSGIDYELMNEAASYTLTSVTNDLGGQMGLWTGISLICVLEIIILFIVGIAYFLFGRKITKDVDITDAHRSKDKRYDEMRNLKEELDTQEIMDDEIKFRYRELQMRPERKRLERLDQGYRLNEQAVKKAGMKEAARRRRMMGPRPPPPK